MTGYRAFGDEAGKQALRADIHAKGPVYAAWLTQASMEGDLTPVSRDHGLHPALVRLLPALGDFGQGEEAPAFYDALLAAIPVGAGTADIARQAVLLAWTDPTYGRAARVAPGVARAACEAIVDLVRRSMHAPIDKPAWRAARARLAQAQREAPAPQPVVDLMLSMAWDLEQSPGAVQDVMLAWTTQLSAEAEAADEDPFNEAEAALFKSTMARIHGQAAAGLGEDDDFEYEAFLEEVDRHWAADPATQSLKERSLARQARIRARLALWRSATQQSVLSITRSLVV